MTLKILKKFMEAEEAAHNVRDYKQHVTLIRSELEFRTEFKLPDPSRETVLLERLQVAEAMLEWMSINSINLPVIKKQCTLTYQFKEIKEASPSMITTNDESVMKDLPTLSLRGRKPRISGIV